jgi:hypothetical protein
MSNLSHPAISSELPTDVLEQAAIEQRRRMHETVTVLRGQVREKLDVRHQAAEHVWPVSGATALLSLLLGYGTAGMIKDLFR